MRGVGSLLCLVMGAACGGSDCLTHTRVCFGSLMGRQREIRSRQALSSPRQDYEMVVKLTRQPSFTFSVLHILLHISAAHHNNLVMANRFVACLLSHCRIRTSLGLDLDSAARQYVL